MLAGRYLQVDTSSRYLHVGCEAPDKHATADVTTLCRLAAVRVADRYLATHKVVLVVVVLRWYLVYAMQAPLASRKSCFFGTSWEQRWWPRHYRNSARLAVSCLARDCRLYVARHEVMSAGSYSSSVCL